MLAEKAVAVFSAGLSGRLSTPTGWSRSRPPSRVFRPWGFTPTNLHEFQLPTGMSGGARLLDDFLDRNRPLSGSARFSRAEGAVHPFGASCASAPCRSARSPPRPGSRVGAARRPGCPNSSGAISIIRFSGTAPTSPQPRLQAPVRRAAVPNPPGHFEAWCQARTGYPLVDAAMPPVEPDRLHAQPPAYGRRLVPDQGSAGRLAAR